MNSKNNIEKWILADWSSNRSPEVSKNTEVKSEQNNEHKAGDNSCKCTFIYKCSYNAILCSACSENSTYIYEYLGNVVKYLI